MTQILSLLATFILTTVVGNYLLQNWQHRGWVRQQQFLGSEKEYLELRSLSTEISGEIGARLYQTKRLLWAVRSFSLEIVEQRLAIYDTTQVRWNEKLGVFFVGLTLFADYSYTNRLETDIHMQFQRIGGQIERMARLRRTSKKPSFQELGTVEARLNDLQGTVFNFNRDLLKFVEQKRESVYFGRAIEYSERNLRRFSSMELIKALFIREVDSHTVTRPSADVV